MYGLSQLRLYQTGTADPSHLGIVTAMQFKAYPISDYEVRSGFLGYVTTDIFALCATHQTVTWLLYPEKSI